MELERKKENMKRKPMEFVVKKETIKIKTDEICQKNS